MQEIGSVYVGDGPKLMGGYLGHDLRGTGPGGRDRSHRPVSRQRYDGGTIEILED